MNSPTSRTFEQFRSSSPLVLLALFAVALFVSVLWYWSLPAQFDTFAGDDLMVHRGQEAGEFLSSLRQVILEPAFEKYRPVNSLLFLGTYRLLGDDFRSYLILNTILHALLCATLGFALWRHANVALPVSLAVTLLAASSRFAYYNVIQRHGIMEIAALFFAFVSVASLLVFVRSGSRRMAWLALGAFALCIHTHERYIALTPVMVLGLFLKRHLKPADWLVTGIPALLVAANIGVKQVLLKVAFMTGTGGSQVSMDIASMIKFMEAGLSSILGFDVGPHYLSGIDFSEHEIWAPCVLIVAGGAALMLLPKMPWKDAAIPAILLSTTVLALVFSASVTIRQEYRWLYSAEFFLIGGLALFTENMSPAAWLRPARLAFLTSAAGFLAANVVVRNHATNLHFFGWLRDAESIRRTIIDGASEHLAIRPVYLVDNFADPRLFEQYSPNVKIALIPIKTPDLLRLSPEEIRNGLFYGIRNGHWTLLDIDPSMGANADGQETDQVTAEDMARIPRLRELVPRAGENWYYSYLIGQEMLGRNPRKAERYFRDAIALVGAGNPYPYFSLGLLLEQQGRLQEALDNLEMAMRYDNQVTPDSTLAESAAALRSKLQASGPKAP